MRIRPTGLALALGALTLALLAVFSQDAPRSHAQGGEVLEISSGFRHTCAVTTAGISKCWGNAGNYRLGNGQLSPNRLTPVNSTNVQDGLVDVAGGWAHTCGLTSYGEVRCWGNNFRGPLGDGTETDRSTAVAVCADATCASHLTGVTAIDAGDRHTCALNEGGGVKCWGRNSSGELGDGQSCDLEACPTPVDVGGLAGDVIDVSGGIWHTCAVISTGTVQCWGRNNAGQLGNGTANDSPAPVTVFGITNAVDVEVGGETSCAILNTDAVKCWGRNEDGQLGDGQACSTTICTFPTDVSGITDAASMTIGEDHVCVVTTAGALRCWGGNSEGQLGEGQLCGVQFCSSPIDPTGLGLGVQSVDAGSFHTCVLLIDHKMRCMGANGSGQLGDGSGGDFDDFSATPVQVDGVGSANSDGDAMNDAVDDDDDNDHCPDSRELLGDPALGGRRNPKVYWDFFDTPAGAAGRDQIISIGDVFRVVGLFGLNGNPNLDPESDPVAGAYHTAFDRSAPVPGQDAWDLGPPDGSISTGDVLFSVNQFGHSCTVQP